MAVSLSLFALNYHQNKQLVDSVSSLLSAHYETIFIGQSLLFWVKYSSDGEDEGGKHT